MSRSFWLKILTPLLVVIIVFTTTGNGALDLTISSQHLVEILCLAILLLTLWIPGKIFTVSVALLCTAMVLSVPTFTAVRAGMWSPVLGHPLSLVTIWVFAAVILMRKRSERLTVESQERYRALFDRSMDLVCVQDFDGQILDANPTALAALGYTREEFRQLNFKSLVDPAQIPQATKVLDELKRTGAQKDIIEYRIKHKNGEYLLLESKSSVVHDQGRPRAILAIARDVTERRRNEEVITRAKRLETAGELAAQIAHDFNNLLTPLVGYPDMIRTHLPPKSPACHMLDDMEMAALRITDINQELLTLGRRGYFNPSRLDLNELVQSVLSYTVIPSGIALTLDLDKSLGTVVGGSAQLGRAVMNLIINAVDAMEGNGRLTIRTGNIVLGNRLRLYPSVNSGEYARIDITDTGSGIPNQVIDHIFEPFFTTKIADRSRGSGLGLSVVHAVLDDHHGYVDVDTRIGGGTTFSLFLPVCKSEAEARPAEVVEVRSRRNMPLHRAWIPRLAGAAGTVDGEVKLDSSPRSASAQGDRAVCGYGDCPLERISSIINPSSD